MKRMILVLAALGFAVPASATPNVPVKCAANEERVWVYDNLTTWDVTARLRCGSLVAVLGAEKGYVKVLTADGNEGYVPTDAVPSSELAHVIVVVNPAPAVTVAAAARANEQAENTQPAAAPGAPPNVAPASRPVELARVEAVPSPAPELPGPANPARPATMAPPAAPVPPAPSPAQESKPAPAHVPNPGQAPAPVPNAPPVTRASRAASRESYVTPTPTPSATGRENATLVVEDMNTPVPPPALQPAPKVVKAANFMTITRKGSSIASRTREYSDNEDLPDADAVPTEDLSACSVYFSAYGVTPMQYKWIADERSKEFPAVCPAPEPSMVDYVVIFTHDLDSFITTLPDPIHTDSNGFSDWTPVTAVDDTQIPASELDKARREYAWVFRVHRGTYNPKNVTPRWRPLYTKTEHASAKSIEDAMQFMASNGATQ